MNEARRKDGWQPTYGMWQLFVFEPFNSNTGLRVRLWLRVS